MAKIPIVDENDEVLYQKERDEISPDEIYRVSACWIVNSQWDILLAQRSFTKKHHPGMRWPAVAGTVTWDETYLENILHEISEEIWIEILADKLKDWPYYFSDGEHKHFTKWFITVLDVPNESLTKEEWAVQELRWRTPKQLDDIILDTPKKMLSSVCDWRNLFWDYFTNNASN